MISNKLRNLLYIVSQSPFAFHIQLINDRVKLKNQILSIPRCHVQGSISDEEYSKKICLFAYEPVTVRKYIGDIYMILKLGGAKIDRLAYNMQECSS